MENTENLIEGKAFDPQPQPPEDESRKQSAKTAKGTSEGIGGVWKQVENIGQTLGEALQGRGNVVMVRVNDDTLAHLDMLVEAELVKSRSEAAALLIIEGMKANEKLFERIREITDQIAILRSQLKESVKPDRPDNAPEMGEES